MAVYACLQSEVIPNINSLAACRNQRRTIDFLTVGLWQSLQLRRKFQKERSLIFVDDLNIRIWESTAEMLCSLTKCKQTAASP